MTRFPRSEASSQIVNNASRQQGQSRSAKQKTVFAAVLLCRIDPDDPNDHQCLVVPQYVDTLHPRELGIPLDKRIFAFENCGIQLQLKFPGGTGKRQGETPPEIAVREINEETGYLLKTPLERSHVISEVPKGTDHTQYFFFIPPGTESLEGELRTEPLLDTTGEKDEILMSPIWLGVRGLRDTIYWSHRKALENAYQYLTSN